MSRHADADAEEVAARQRLARILRQNVFSQALTLDSCRLPARSNSLLQVLNLYCATRCTGGRRCTVQLCEPMAW